MRFTTITLCTFALSASWAFAGPLTWEACQTACNTGYVACCASTGTIAGVLTLGLGIPAALVGCSAVQGACMAACTPLLIAPTP